MKQKGFTLIELLAVILILGIIALIAIPTITTILKEAKRSAANVSANNYLSGVEALFAKNDLYNIAIEDGSYDPATFLSDNIKGSLPTSGSVVITDGKLENLEVCINGFQFSYDGENMLLASEDCTVLNSKPTYAIVEEPDTLTSSKTVTVDFGTDATEEYVMIKSGKASYNETELTNNEWVSVTGPTVSIKFSEAGSLISKKTIGAATVLGNKVVVKKIDSIKPIIDLSTIPTTITYDATNPSTVYSFTDYALYGEMGVYTSCVSDLNPGFVNNKTTSLTIGTNNLTCTATGSNGLTTTANITINFNVNTSYTVESLLSGVKNLDLPNGNYTFTVATGTETIAYPVEIVNYYENTTFSSNVSIGDSTTTKKMLVAKFHKNLTIASGVTVTATNVSSLTYKKGMFVYVDGTLTNNGTITMTARGTYNQAGENVYLYKNSGGTYEYIPAVGGAGGATVSLTNAASLSKAGTAGAVGVNRGTGGGGSGGVFNNVSGTSISGIGGAGTSYSGGAGGGATTARGVTYTGYGGSSIGGAGGAGHSNVYSDSAGYAAGGGAGNLGGSYAGATCCTRYSGGTGTGGLLIISANDLVNTGTISSIGAVGGYATGASGGSSGGGSINIFTTNSYSSTGTISAAGGTAQTYGSAGGVGTVTKGSISTGAFVAY